MKFVVIIVRLVDLVGAQVINNRGVKKDAGRADQHIVHGCGEKHRFEGAARLAGHYGNIDLTGNRHIIKIDTAHHRQHLTRARPHGDQRGIADVVLILRFGN